MSNRCICCGRDIEEGEECINVEPSGIKAEKYVCDLCIDYNLSNRELLELLGVEIQKM